RILMSTSNRREFLKNAAVSGTAVSAGLAAAGISSQRVFSEETSNKYELRFRELGSTGFKVTEIGFGAMNMRDPELVQAAVDAGINYIDTAHKYMNGVNEQVIGKVMMTKRDRVFLTTKVADEDIPGMTTNLETSLKRLNTDHVDLLLAHSLNTADLLTHEEILRHLEDAKRKGKTRFIGYSTHQLPDEYIDETLKADVYDAILVSYNYLSPPEVARNIKRAREAGIAIIAMKTQLKGKGNPDTSSDLQTPNQAALKWVLENEYVDTAIPGVTTFEQLNEDLKVMGMELSSRESHELRRYGESLKGKYCCGVLGCNGCKDRCPYGVAIHEVNRCLGYAFGYGDLRLAKENYAEIPAGYGINACSDCDECQVRCINGLNLTENMRRARSLFC
ncbi:aldo/keto reductase, partial [Candidatus Latescibacterota bacterium]